MFDEVMEICCRDVGVQGMQSVLNGEQVILSGSVKMSGCMKSGSRKMKSRTESLSVNLSPSPNPRMSLSRMRTPKSLKMI